MKSFEVPSDLKYWYAISCPTTGVRFDARTLEFIDTDHDGRIRSEELVEALELLKRNGYEPSSLFGPNPSVAAALEGNLKKQAELANAVPSDDDRAALADWEAKGKTNEIAVLGEDTAAAEAALTAIEPIIDAYFTPPADMPLVTEAPDVVLPLKDHLNPKHLEAILDFAAKCARPILGTDVELTRLGWKKVKAAFAPYRAWAASKPVVNAGLKDTLLAEEKLLRYRLYLGEFLVNYVTMDALYEGKSPAIFQTGILRIDGKEMNLCFHVESEGAHSALVSKSNCCVIYLKLVRPADKVERQICAVVTAGTVAGLYVGRNGVFYDRDGKLWEAVITKVVESQVSLAEAFWEPWRKLGESISGMVKKFLGERQAKSTAMVTNPTAAQPAKDGGAAIASSVAAIGIGVGMVGAAAASLMAALSSMTGIQILGAIIGLILVVSLPSVILTWFKLRRRDLAAILNACGWAVNRPMRFSMARARGFTKCAKGPSVLPIILVFVLILAAIGGYSWYTKRAAAEEGNRCNQTIITETEDIQNA